MDYKLIVALLRQQNLRALRLIASKTGISLATLNRMKYGSLMSPRLLMVEKLAAYFSEVPNGLSSDS